MQIHPRLLCHCSHVERHAEICVHIASALIASGSRLLEAKVMDALRSKVMLHPGCMERSEVDRILHERHGDLRNRPPIADALLDPGVGAAEWRAVVKHTLISVAPRRVLLLIPEALCIPEVAADLMQYRWGAISHQRLQRGMGSESFAPAFRLLAATSPLRASQLLQHVDWADWVRLLAPNDLLGVLRSEDASVRDSARQVLSRIQSAQATVHPEKVRTP